MAAEEDHGLLLLLWNGTAWAERTDFCSHYSLTPLRHYAITPVDTAAAAAPIFCYAIDLENRFSDFVLPLRDIAFLI